MKLKTTLLFVCVLVQTNLFSQKKINTDSLLTVTNRYLNTDKNYAETKRLAHLGIRLAPNYYDFHIALGRACRYTNEPDSARYYFNTVMSKNPKYKEAFVYMAQIELESKNAEPALAVTDKAIQLYPDEQDFYWLKLRAIELGNDETKTMAYLNTFAAKFPNDTKIKNHQLDLKLNSNSDRIGANLTLTSFDRAGVGPWYLSSLQYIRQREKITLIGRYNYTDRQSYRQSIANGSLTEIESYIKWKKKHYSFANIGIGSGTLFPKVRLNYSSFLNIISKWEFEVGIRYNKNTAAGNYSSVLGVGTYIGSGLLNLRSYLNLNTQKKYPSFTASYRYYVNSRFDYYAASLGYGTSPDERETLPQFEQRIALSSYRMGLGYSKVLFKKYIISIHGNFNRQEYFPQKYQNELTTSIQLQYLF
jgi:YaiO family outer membrane protein